MIHSRRKEKFHSSGRSVPEFLNLKNILSILLENTWKIKQKMIMMMNFHFLQENLHLHLLRPEMVPSDQLHRHRVRNPFVFLGAGAFPPHRWLEITMRRNVIVKQRSPRWIRILRRFRGGGLFQVGSHHCCLRSEIHLIYLLPFLPVNQHPSCTWTMLIGPAMVCFRGVCRNQYASHDIYICFLSSICNKGLSFIALITNVKLIVKLFNYLLLQQNNRSRERSGDCLYITI